MMFFPAPILAVVILQLTFLVGWGFDYSRIADKGSEIETIIHHIPKLSYMPIFMVLFDIPHY